MINVDCGCQMAKHLELSQLYASRMIIEKLKDIFDEFTDYSFYMKTWNNIYFKHKNKKIYKYGINLISKEDFHKDYPECIREMYVEIEAIELITNRNFRIFDPLNLKWRDAFVDNQVLFNGICVLDRDLMYINLRIDNLLSEK